MKRMRAMRAGHFYLLQEKLSGRWFLYFFRDGKRIVQGLPDGYETEKEARDNAARYSSP